jgi:hypothetical protein
MFKHKKVHIFLKKREKRTEKRKKKHNQELPKKNENRTTEKKVKQESLQLPMNTHMMSRPQEELLYTALSSVSGRHRTPRTTQQVALIWGASHIVFPPFLPFLFCFFCSF